MKFTFLVDNKTEDTRCRAEWGLSILIETKGNKILLDTGASSLFAENAAKMGIDLKTIDALVISHGHYDHTEGVPAFSEINRTAPIYLHKEALFETYGETNGKIEAVTCGIRWSESFRREIQPRICFTEGVYKLYENVTLVGNIPDMEGFIPTETFYKKVHTKQSDGGISVSYEKDYMRHEQALIVEEDQGLYLFSGCSHRGVVPTVDYVRRLFPGKRISALIAGMHLYPVSKEERKQIVKEITAIDLDTVFPVHCTGTEGILMLKECLGDRCIIASAGDSYEY